jgi:hypothetical protein
MELTKYERELKDRSEKIVDDLTKLVNSMSFKPDYFIEAMSKEHRTLQQSFTKLCLQWLEYVASDDYMSDGRNVASHTTARALMNFWKDVHGSLPSQMLPLI